MKAIVYEKFGSPEVLQLQEVEKHTPKNKKRKMKIKKLVIEFGTVFTVALVTGAIVTFLWNLITRGESTVGWETSFRFAILFGIILTWANSWEVKEK